MQPQRVGYVDDDTWSLIQQKVPIACVDFIPVRRASSGSVREIGLVLRDTPFSEGRLWCHLGGRVDRGESLQDALHRHADSTLGATAGIRFPHNPAPLATMEWFPSGINPDRNCRNPWQCNGEDPRQHAISLCFIYDASPDLQVVIAGEAVDFKWFTLEALDDASLWPGSMTLIYKVLASDTSSSAERSALLRTTYSTLAARALNHNSLIWQTPALALAAEAFLLTIALNPAATMAAKVFAASLNLMLSLLCYQLMTKHREMMNLDRDDLVEIERLMGSRLYHDRPQINRFTRQGRYSSSLLWQIGFLILAAVSIAIVVLSVLHVGIYA